MSLHRYLTRLIFFCVAPLVLLAAYLAFERVHAAQTEYELDAGRLVAAVAAAVDQDLRARIGALHMLSQSAFVDDAAGWGELQREAQGFVESFGSHVILADTDFEMRLSTRRPGAAGLGRLPRPSGRAAAPTALATGKPAVGDLFIGSFVNTPMVAIAVPAERAGRVVALLLTTVETQQLQTSIERFECPPGWALTLVDGSGAVIAQHGGQRPPLAPDAAKRFAVNSTASPWSVVLEIPSSLYYSPLAGAAAAMIVALLGATIIGVVGGLLASRRLGRAVASLVSPASAAAPTTIVRIDEIAAVREVLDAAAERSRLAEEGRRESEQRFRVTFDQAAVGIALIAPDGRWLGANHKLCEIVGYSAEELASKSVKELTHPADRDYGVDYVREMLDGNIASYELEKRYLHKDGSAVWAHLSVALVRKDDGSPDYFIAVIEDIGWRRQAEAARRESEAELAEAQHIAQIGSWRWDLHSDATTASDELHRIFGRADIPPFAEQKGTLYADAAWDELDAAARQAVASGVGFDLELPALRGDGAEIWINTRCYAIRDDEGAVTGLRGTIQDISRRKNAEDEIRRLNADLEKRVEQRTAELVAINQELDTFAYAVSHDLRAPLRAMGGFSKALAEDYGDRFDADGRAYLEQIGIASRRMGELIDGVLTLSRTTRGSLERGVIDVSALAQNVFDELARGEPGRRVVFEVEAGLVADGDARMIYAVLHNLLGNAWKYTTKTAQPAIRVFAGEVDGVRGICVADNGAGFDMNYADQLFQPFRRLHRQDEFPGIGVGLTTVQRIVRRHGGTIRAQAAVGAGATFCFTLTPAADA